MSNRLIGVKGLYIPLVLLALKNWQSHRLYLALDTTVLWNRYCMIHLSLVCCGRAVPFLWQVKEHSSATVAFEEYQPLLRQARWILRQHADVMLKADRGFANHALMNWLQRSNWHYCLRLPCDVNLHGPRRYPIEVSYLWPQKGEAVFYHHVGLWQDGKHRSHLVLANVKGVKEPWAVITDETPTLKTLWQYGLRFRVEELFLDSKSGAFELEDSRIRSASALERLYERGCGGTTVRHDSRHGCSTTLSATAGRSRSVTKGQSSLAKGSELPENWSALANGSPPQKSSTFNTRPLATQRPATVLCFSKSSSGFLRSRSVTKGQSHLVLTDSVVTVSSLIRLGFTQMCQAARSNRIFYIHLSSIRWYSFENVFI